MAQKADDFDGLPPETARKPAPQKEEFFDEISMESLMSQIKDMESLVKFEALTH